MSKMITTEEKIWNEIIESAKRKFDFSFLEKNFPFDSDYIVFKIIAGFAANEQKNIIALGLFNEILQTGYKCDIEKINQLIEDKEDLFKLEIFTSKIAADMLNNGSSPIQVYDSIIQLLNSK